MRPVKPFAPFMARLAIAATLAAVAGAALARDQVQVAGSSTVLPYAAIVAEAFGENFGFRTPVVESGGSSAGLKRFCEGLGEGTIDIANSSRRIRPRELAACAANGVRDIIELRIGYDGIVFASDIDGPKFEFTPQDWFLALAQTVIVDGKPVRNPYRSWTEVNPALPDQKILAFVPGTKHGTREVFEEKVILQGCRDSGAYARFEAIHEGDHRAVEKACITLRGDSVSVDIDGDYTETLARIVSNPHAIGVFGLSFYESNTDKLRLATVSGVTPSVASIAAGDYPVSRPLFIYVKKAHIGVIPGLKAFAGFFLADEVAGPGGPLAEYGLVPDPALDETQKVLADETTIDPGIQP